ncbi:unnamed protein product [Hanseniaspora opuntiae]|uniref:Uncharacterized protein n=1 Tax=Hanseniaspora opuntiae TaxID=211096 RepID=A0A1E5RSN2_9ASCO|nr:hypothetical protein AWRI3578_g1275 [Hanseniaspora opuntiae]
MFFYKPVNPQFCGNFGRLTTNKGLSISMRTKVGYSTNSLNTEKMLQFYKAKYEKYNKRKYYKYYALGTILTLGIVGYQTSETANATLKYGYMSAKRIYNVTSALTKCIYYYSMTISKRDKMPIEEYSELLRNTHQKSADVALDAIQQNGGIYIKLRPTHIGNDISFTSRMD